ncbi:MAG: hypothetical protein HDR04_03645 [Lachnospiraceae bacterium]|nr:hypothetical protein [Lachnospiraceae bacterium]
MRGKYLSSYDAVLVNNELLLFNSACGLLMKYNVEDFSYKVEAQIKYDKACVKRLIKAGRDIFLVFLNKKGIIKYNLDTHITEIYGGDDTLLEKHQKIWGAFINDCNIWLFPTYISGKIAFFNIRTKKQEEYMSIKNLFKLKGIALKEEDYVSNLHQLGNKIWAAVCGTTYVFSFSLVDKKMQIFDTKCDDITSFHYDGKDFWIYTAKERCIINWNPEYGQCEEYYIDSEVNIGEDECFWFICSAYNKIFMIPYLDYNILVIERNSGICSSLGFAEHFFRVDNKLSLSLFGGCLMQKNKLILLPNAVNQIVICNLINNKIEFCEGKLYQKDYERYYLLEVFGAEIYMEVAEYPLEQFIGVLKMYNNSTQCNSKENVGKKIYKNM